MAETTKQVVAIARIYKRIYIYQEPGCFVIYGEGDSRFEFISQCEAEAFVDAWEMAMMHSAVIRRSITQ